MGILSKKREVIIGGMKATFTIKNGQVKSFAIRDRTFLEKSFSSFINFGANGNIDIGKLPKDFIRFLEKSDGKETINLNNPLYERDLKTKDMIYRANLVLQNAINKHATSLSDKDSINSLEKNELQRVINSGLIRDKNLPLIKETLDKPVGLRGALYKSLKAIVEFNAKDLVEKLSPEKMDISKYASVDYNKIINGGSNISEPAISSADIEKKAMLDAIIKLNETMDSIKAALGENRSINEAVKPTAEPIEESAKVANSGDKKEVVVNTQQNIKHKEPKVNFGSKDVQADITNKWGSAKEKNISSEEPCVDFLNINAVRYNGISKAKLDRWKEKEISKNNPEKTEEVLSGYIEKNLAYAKELVKIGVLKEVSPEEFEFSSPAAKEVLYKNYDKPIDVIQSAMRNPNRKMRGDSTSQNDTQENSIDSTQSSIAEKSKMGLEQFNHLVKESGDKLAKFTNMYPNLFVGDDAKIMGEEFNKFVENLTAQKVPFEIFEKEITGCVNRLITHQRGRISKASLDDINYAFAPDETSGGFEQFARSTAMSAQGLEGASEGEQINQNISSSVLAEAADEIKKLEERDIEGANELPDARPIEDVFADSERVEAAKKIKTQGL